MALQTKTISANGSKGHHKFTLTVNEDSTNRENNSSAISWNFKLSAVQAGWDWVYTGSVSYTITINGTKYTGTIDSYDGSSTITVKSGSNTITHNSDGTKSISYSFSVSSYDVSYLPGSAGASGTMTLTNIARSASITSVPASFNDETASITIGYTNPLGNTADVVKTCITMDDGYTALCSYRNVSKTGTSYTYTFTDAEKTKFRNAITSGYSIRVRIYITTEVGGNTYYTNKTSMLSLVNASPQLAAPIIRDTNTAITTAIKGTKSGTMIYGQSNLYYEYSATGRKGATITSYKVVCGSYTSTSRTGTITGVKASGTNPTITCEATDSRGNKIVSTYTLNMVFHMVPEAYVEEGSLSTSSGNLYFTVRGYYTRGYLDGTTDGSNGGSKNTAQVQYRIKPDGGSYGSWITATDATLTEDQWDSFWTVGISGLDYTTTYKVQIRLKDLISTGANGEEYTMRMVPVFDWSRSDFAINVPTRLNDDLYMKNNANEHVLTMSYDYTGESTGLEIGYGGYQDGSNTTIYGDAISMWVNNDVFINGQSLERVVSSGTASMGSNGTWYWRKWSSGMAECWGTRNYGNMAITTAWGTDAAKNAGTSLYVSADFTQALPSGLFNGVPDYIDIQPQSGGYGSWVSKGYDTTPSKTSTGTFCLVRATSATLSQVNISFRVIGRWK